MSRPPWEVYLIDGLDHVERVPAGGFALLIKVHHAAIDGVAGAEMLTRTLRPRASRRSERFADAMESGARAVPGPSARRRHGARGDSADASPGPRASPGKRFGSCRPPPHSVACGNCPAHPLQRANLGRSRFRRPDVGLERLQADQGPQPRVDGQRRGPRRDRWSLASVSRVAAANFPLRSLWAMVPVSLRTGSTAGSPERPESSSGAGNALGNETVTMAVRLHTDEPDDTTRYLSISASARESKSARPRSAQPA